MSELLRSILAIVILGIIVAIVNKPLRNLLKKFIRCRQISCLVLKILIFVAERKKVFKPPGSGPQKKAWVKLYYDKWIDQADDAVDATIDFIVSALNSRKANYKVAAEEQMNSVTDEAITKALKTKTIESNTTEEIINDDGNEDSLSEDSDVNDTAVG